MACYDSYKEVHPTSCSEPGRHRDGASDAPMEQRKYQRFTDSSLVTFASENTRGEGRLDNLSLGGAAILSDIAISRGEYVTVTITLPAQAGTIEIELAPVRWVKAGSFGVEFIRIAPASQEILKQYLTTLESTSTDAG